MFKFLRKMKGQSTLEYAVLVIIVIGALLSIQIYIKRGIQGRMRSAADDIGDQYSAGNTNVTKTVTVHSRTNEVMAGGDQSSSFLDPETTNTIRSQNIVNLQQEYWGQ